MTKVLVAMSGGVDSSVAAFLLKEQGYDVVGVTMQIWEATHDWGGCCSLDSIDDARRVAKKLDIPHYVLNFRDIFQKKVIDNFCSEYRAGRTPNPCIRCNQYIKFDELLHKADEIGADFISTGHYAQVVLDEKINRYLLKRGVDEKKDQSYVLYVLNQEQLKRTILPVGGLTKPEVRKIAKECGLAVADKKDSQEICFIPDNDYGRFLKERVPDIVNLGQMLDVDGKVVGKHNGVCFYTIGQRKGLGVSFLQPKYVVNINVEKNAVIVGDREYVYGTSLIANELNVVGCNALDDKMDVTAKIRYAHKAAKAKIEPMGDDKFKLSFDEPQWAITPGQAAVFYNNDIVLGGGTIISKVV